MNLNNKITILKNINYFNFDGPYSESTSYNSNNAVTRIITNFVRKYYDEIKRHYTIIIKYDNDVYSYLAFRLIRAAGIAIQTELDIRILGNIKSPEEKEFFKGIKTIGYRKAKKEKRAILITGHHPICNVENLAALSKVFIEIYNPIETITPENLNLIQDFYLKDDSSLYQEKLGCNNLDEAYWYYFFKYPVGNKAEKVKLANSNQDYYFFPVKLSGTEEDFGLFDEIRKIDKENGIIIYDISNLNEEQIKFIKCNLNLYISFKNQLNDFNSFTHMEIKLMFDTIPTIKCLMEYTNYKRKEEEDVDSNS